MTFYQILILALLTNLCLVDQLPAQSTQNNVASVKDIYDAVQNKDTSILMVELAPKIKGFDTNVASEAIDRYRITLAAILQNHWEQIKVINLQIEEMNGNVVLAQGVFMGRLATDCEIITTRFQHIWSLKDGNILEFKEESIKQKI